MSVRNAHGADHNDLHSEEGAQRGEHPGRSRNPLIKVRGLAWLEFAKPDLDRAETFAHAFGFSTAYRTRDTLYLRGAAPDPPCVIVRRGPRTKFLGPAFTAADGSDVLRLGDALGRPLERLDTPLDGLGVRMKDPSGMPLRVVADVTPLAAEASAEVHDFNFGRARNRVNATQRPPRAPAQVLRLGHVVVMSNRYQRALQWYLDNLGMIVSDFLYYPGQRHRGPVMSFIRCDRGGEAADHHTLAMTLGPSNRYVHSAYEVTDFDAVEAGGEYLLDRGYGRSWGVGRHIQGSQIFDYWRDPDGFLVEHYADGDLFDSSMDPGWAAMTASGLSQWGPRATADFLGLGVQRDTLQMLRDTIISLSSSDNEFDLRRLRGLLKVPRS
ncbi:MULTISPECIES: VOC family protein [unclassified Brevibacterium]|uniref:VOC family protein n=1 Tax=unclassified Brevibacterium TaxID=2614124 RepID=UPI0010F63505|nr:MULTISPECIES: VOC family protein [unclassified Brevibacterium]MCM1011982.1 VOC family protein [Brevibacterium sp. XM4083]